LASYAWGKDSSRLLSNTKVQLVVDNVFNAWPPFNAFNAPFYYSPYGDLQLRTFHLSLKKSF
jgi:hypothetical protein